MSLRMSIFSAPAAKNLMPNLFRSMGAQVASAGAASGTGATFSCLGLLLAQALVVAIRRFDEQLRFFDQVTGLLDVEHAVLVGMTVQQIQRELAAGVLACVRRLEQLRIVEARLELRDDAIRILRHVPQLRAHQ